MNDLAGPVAVLSPHLDDAVLSLGAAIAGAAAAGASVRVVTVLAGDPASARPAGPWDRAAGFRTAGEAARARREEDRRACEIVGAEPVWLPFGDVEYGRGAGDDEIWDAVARATSGARLLLVPGSPLVHPDHRWLATLALKRVAGPLGLYAEQPYTMSRRRRGGPRLPESLAALLPGPPPSWSPLPAGRPERRAKRRALRAYRSQLPLLSRRPFLVWRIAHDEARRGGESVAWVSSRNHRS